MLTTPHQDPPYISPEGLVHSLAREDFNHRYGTPRLEPVVVVIPSFDEAANVGAVVAAVPATVDGLAVSTLVVVDGTVGENDNTAKVVEQAGGYACVMPAHMGQGVALRLGYALARENGGQFIITVDADGQYDLEEMEALAMPVLRGDADFVQGSRRLAGSRRGSLARWIGVYVFSWLISSLTGTSITDSSNGFRAMTVAVPEAVSLTEDQYQTAELLISAIGRGFRVVERPAGMKPRTSGTTKKGGNLLFGAQYARVIGKTYLREQLQARRQGRRFGTPVT